MNCREVWIAAFVSFLSLSVGVARDVAAHPTDLPSVPIAGDLSSWIRVHPTGAITLNSELHSTRALCEEHPPLAVSPSGRCWLTGRAVTHGFDDFWVEEAVVWRAGNVLYRLAEPVGSGLYLSDNGWLASIRSMASGAYAAVLYDSTGSPRTAAQVTFPRAFALAERGFVLVVAARGGTVVLDGPDESIEWLPEASRVAVSAQGSRVALIRAGSVEIWARGKRLASFQSPLGNILGACFLEPETLVLWNRAKVVSVGIQTGQVGFTLKAPPGARFADLAARGGWLAIGLQRKTGSGIRGEAWVLGPSGTVVATRVAEEELPRFGTELGEAFSASGVTYREFVPWPFQPFDQPRPLGNTYEEFQKYGGQPYLHPGIDILVPAHSPVYAVADGIVKAKLTISGDYHWRLAVADEASPDTTEGWLYAHLVRESIPFEVGDTVKAGDYLGRIVPWPVAEFHHLHFVKVRQAGEEWTPDWEAAFNPLDVLRPLADSSAPEFGAVRPDGSPVAYLDAASREILQPDSLRGRVDVVVRVGDRVLSDKWLCSVYELRFAVVDPANGDTLLGPTLAARLSHPLPNYTGGPELARVLYSVTEPFESKGNYDERAFYHILTNTDGDTLIELSDTLGVLDCDRLGPGTYALLVEVKDAAGNRAVAVDTFTVVATETGVERRAGTSVPQIVSFAGSPSPFQEGITLSWVLGRPLRPRIRIYDVRGRLVRDTGHLETSASGMGQWRWDGRDQIGRPVPSGIYLVRLETPVVTKTLRIIRLR